MKKPTYTHPSRPETADDVMKIVNENIDRELSLTPPNKTLLVNISWVKEGLQLDFSRVPRTGRERVKVTKPSKVKNESDF